MTQNDYRILLSVMQQSNPDDDKGLYKAKGTTIYEIINETSLSRTKVNKTIKSFIDMKLLDYGLSNGNAKTYVLTEKGLIELKELGGDLDE